ncbi:MAG: ketoacyl-ACP synthase III [Deltaproteobacteria bacterium]|nr:ketoacyl-ACP synthase III [Deltaproteobacteria bacterium]
MNFTFRNKKISGILTILPAHEQKFVDDMKNFNFSEARSLKLKQVMGYDRHRLVTGGTCASDLAIFGFRHLFDQELLAPDSLDGLIVVTQSPDYFMPPTSNVIQGELGLRHDMLCLDINQGCAGFVVGLIQAFLMLEQDSISRVALVNMDVLSRKVSVKDRNSYPLIGDAASITIVEKSEGGAPIFANSKMDGTRREALMIPAGGFRLPSSPETAVLEDVGDNNFRAKDNLRMDGSAVFNFVQIEVPPMIESLLALAGKSVDSVDWFMFHQPNKFMLEKLCDKMKVPYEKMPSNIVEHFGNASGVTIPTAITFNLGDRLRAESFLVCLAGFGVGLTWSSMLLRLGPLGFGGMIDYP